MLDTGSQINILAAEQFRCLKGSIPLLPSDGMRLETVSGESLSALGIVRVPVYIDGVLIPSVSFFVVDGLGSNLPVPALLGLPFVKEHLHSTNWSDGTFTLNGALDRVHRFDSVGNIVAKSETDPEHRKVTLLKSLTIPPYSCAHVLAEVPSGPLPSDPEGQLLLFEPRRAAFRCRMLSSVDALVSEKYQRLKISIDNHTSRSRSCPAGMCVGTVCHVSLVSTEERRRLRTSTATVGLIQSMADSEDSDTDNEEKIEQEDDIIELLPNVHLNLAGSIPLSSDDRRRFVEVLRSKLKAFASHPKKTPTTPLTSHYIDTGQHRPINVPPYRTGPAQKEEIDKLVQDMLDNNVIRPSKSPYSSPVLLVKKSDGSYRFCVDYRKLNAITKRDVYPLPRIDDTLDMLGQARYFSTLDLQSGFWQIPVNPGDVEKTAFSTARGHFEFPVMPFGLTNAPATFQRFMDIVLRDLKAFCLVYIDDIIIFSRTLEEHLQHLRQVFDKLIGANIVVKPSKCHFLRPSVKFLGHIVSENSIRPDPEKVSSVHAFPVPRSVHELQSFMGLVGYYRRFVRSLSTIAAPLYHLFKKHVRWQWTAVEQTAFDELKDALTSEPVLALPDFDRPFILHTDASATGIGAVLTQLSSSDAAAPNSPDRRHKLMNGRQTEFVIYYASRTLSKAERQYGTTQRECLAVKWAICLFRPFLLGRHFTVYTDHNALRWLFSCKDPGSRLTRTILELQEYSFDVIPRPGSQNGNADALSRLPGLLEARGNTFTPVDGTAAVHSLVAAVTRSATGSLPAPRRDGIDPDLALHPHAYDVDLALEESLEDAPEPPRSLDDLESGDTETTDTNNMVVDSADSDSGPSEADLEMKYDSLDADIHGDSASPGTSLDLASAQRADPELRLLILCLTEPNNGDPSVTPQVRQEAALYELLGGVLYRKPEGSNPPGALPALRPVIPASLQLAVLREHHDGACGAHLGQAKTYGKLSAKYYWRGMYDDVKKYVQSCQFCAARKTPYHHREIPIGSLPIPSQPFEALGIDVLGPLPKTRAGNQFILVVTDYFTRWPMAFPMKNQRAATIATLLVEQVFCQHGFPNTLLSDLGRNFLSDLMAAVLTLFHVRKLNTTAYHPQTNGLTERFNLTLVTMLTHFTNRQQNDWDTYIPYVLLAYRSAPHPLLRTSPFYVLYGRNIRYPFDTLLPAIAKTYHLEPVEMADYMVRLIDRLKLAHAAVTGRFNAAALQREQNNAELVDVPEYAIGQKVLIRRPHVRSGMSHKLSALWKGPYEVIERYNNKVNYRVQLLDRVGRKIPRAKPLMVHISGMKAYYAPQISQYRLSSGRVVRLVSRSPC
jgi:hypothetical protein